MSVPYDLVRDRLARTGAVAVATIIERRGPAPSDVGAKMVVSADGEITGSVGGGCGEGQVRRDALDVLRSGRPMIARVDDVMEVFVERLAPDEAPAGGGPTARALLDRLARASAAREPAVVATVIGGEAAPVGTRLLALDGGEWIGPAAPWVADLEGPIAEALATGRTRRVRLLGDASLDVFLESLCPALDLVIAGAGHIALPLATIGKALGFEVTVLDDRAGLAADTRPPEARRLVTGDLVAALGRHPIGPGSYLVLFTRGDRRDVELLGTAVGTGAAYIGVVGSRRRVRALLGYLRRAGVPEAAIARVRAPVDLDVGADTPGAIAVAVAAELASARRAEGTARPPAHGRPRWP